MKTKILLTVILSTILVSCAPVSISTPTETLVPTFMRTVTPIPPTPTTPPEPSLTPIPIQAGPKNGDTRTVTENGHDYAYTYDAELEQWVRKVADFPLWDSTKFNYVPFRISITDSAHGERNVLQIAHVDSISDSDQSPLRSTFKPELEQRYFGLGNLESASNELSIQLQHEMMRGFESTASIPIIIANGTPKGASFNVKLSTETGINVTIMDPEKINALGGESVITLHKGNVTFYIQAYSVDREGNALYRLAFDGLINDIPDEALRDILFMIPGNLVDHIDQREQGFTALAQIFSQYSARPREGGTQDVFFERVLLAHP